MPDISFIRYNTYFIILIKFLEIIFWWNFFGKTLLLYKKVDSNLVLENIDCLKI